MQISCCLDYVPCPNINSSDLSSPCTHAHTHTELSSSSALPKPHLIYHSSSLPACHFWLLAWPVSGSAADASLSAARTRKYHPATFPDTPLTIANLSLASDVSVTCKMAVLACLYLCADCHSLPAPHMHSAHHPHLLCPSTSPIASPPPR